MKILHITESFASGTYIYLKNVCEFLIKHNIDVTIIYSDKRDNFNNETLYKDFNKSIRLIKVDLNKEINLIKDLKISFNIAQLIKEINPDIVHLHSSKASVIGRWSSFLSFHKHKLFYTPHGYSFLREDISKPKQFFYKNIEKYTQVIFGGTTIACGDTEYEIAKQIGLSKLVRNGINVTKISNYYKPKHNNRLTFGIIGRITAQKNPKMFNDIALKFPQYDFIWIGDGELRNLLTANNIKITGWINNSETIFQHINSIDVVLQTSLWEGLPLALLEGLALQKPIVATNVIGNKDVVQHTINGYLFTTINELDNLLYNLENEDFRLKMGENALKICKDRFDNNVNLSELLKIYKK